MYGPSVGAHAASRGITATGLPDDLRRRQRRRGWENPKIGRIVPALPDPVITTDGIFDAGSGASAHHPGPPTRPSMMAPEVTRMPAGGTTITWFGHACVEVRTPGDKVVLFDPWFADPRSRARPSRSSDAT